MEFILLILFLVSLPIFWIWGLISFIRQLSGNKTSPKVNDLSLLHEIVSDLVNIKNKRDSLTKVLEKYKLKLALGQRLSGVETAQEINQPTQQPQAAIVNEEVVSDEIAIQKPLNVITQDSESWWDRWYEENNINLLLYIGAFLIVSSAVIFVGFNWSTFSGAFKAFVLSLITLSFFGSGFFFYKEMPKLKNAGSTFIAIGSLLIPLNGLAWYNFYLRDAGFSFGAVWLLTSLVAIVTYFFLAFFIRNRFYSYIAGLGSLSLVEALVNVGSLNSQYYILGGIFSAFSLLAGSKIIADTKKAEFEQIYSQPLTVSSNIMMPIFLTWGLLAAYSMQRLFTPEVAISTFLASSYYLLSYLISKNITFFVLGELLLTMSAVLTTKTLSFDGAPVFIVIFILALIFQFSGYILSKRSKTQESYYSFFVSIFIALLGLAISYIDPLIAPEQRVYFTLIVSIIAFNASLIEHAPTYLYITFGSINLAAFYYVSTVLHQTELFKYLGLFYLLLGSCIFFAAQLLKNDEKRSEVLKIVSYVNLVLAVIFTFTSATFLAISALIIFAVAAMSRFAFKQDAGYYNYLTSIVVAITALGVSYVDSAIAVEKRIVFTTIVAALSYLATYLEQQPSFLYVGTLAVDLAAYQLIFHQLKFVEPQRYLGITYLILGIIIFILALLYRKVKKDWSEVILQLSGVNLALAVLVTFFYPGLSLTTTLTILVIGLVAAYSFDRKEYIYGAVFFAIFSTFNMLRFMNSPIDYYPLSYIALGSTIYFCHLLDFPKDFRETFQQAGLAITTLTPIIFGFYSLNNPYATKNSLELNSLISAYGASALLTFEAVWHQKGSFGYLASAVGVGTILWQYKYWNITEFQFYAITLAVYFLALAYIKRGQKKADTQQLFDMIGLFILIGPLSLQAFPGNHFWYALLLGFEGVILVLAGFSLDYKTYTYAGAIAIAIATLTRVYSFISSIPSWATIGIGGLFFLGTAIYLLSKGKKLEK